MIPLGMPPQDVAPVAISAAATPRVTASWNRPSFLIQFVANPLYGIGAAIEHSFRPDWSTGVEFLQSPMGLFFTTKLHFWPELRRGTTRNQFLLGVGGDVSVTVSRAAGGGAFWMAPTLDLRYLGRPLPSFGFALGGRLGVGAAFEANDFTSRSRPADPLAHLAVVICTYVGMTFGQVPKLNSVAQE